MKFERHSHISSLLHEALQPVFLQLGVRPEDRHEFIEVFARQLSKGRAADTKEDDSWVERVSAEQSAVTFERTVPDKAPAIWQYDRLTDDTPPAFIIRHYGPEGLDVLREDGTGLALPDLHSMDRTLYNACFTWLAKETNVWPKNCPLPTKRELMQMEIDRVDERLGSVSSADLIRVGTNLRRQGR